MRGKFKKIAFLLVAVIGVGGLMLGYFNYHSETDGVVAGISVNVTEIQQAGNGLWCVPRDAFAEKAGRSEPFVIRLKYLRTERIAAKVVDEAGGCLLIQANDLVDADLLVLEPWGTPLGQPVGTIVGLEEERQIWLTLEAGIAAAMAEDLDNSVRFISTKYRDNYGFDITLMRLLLERAYEEFDKPLIELAEPPSIQMRNSQALVQVRLKVTAIYQDRRNYLLGDQNTTNNIILLLEKSVSGWQVIRIEGLQPLGFQEKFLKILGAQIGLNLTEAERLERQKACMPCRQRMAERFGPES